MNKKIIMLLILAYSVNLCAANEIEIFKSSIAGVSSTEFLLNYSIRNTFDQESSSALQVTIPFEKYIIQGTIEKGILNEKDILFSQLNIDLNADRDINDSFDAKITSKNLTIEKIKISPLTKTTAKYQVLIPFNETGNFNLNRITENGLPFTLRNFSTTPPDITIGLNTEGEIEFRKFSNSLLLVEVITSDKNDEDKLLIDGEKPFNGSINERELTGGESLYRFAAAKKIDMKASTAAGNIIIKGINRPFSVRLTYHFCISDKLVLMNQKIIRVN